MKFYAIRMTINNGLSGLYYMARIGSHVTADRAEADLGCDRANSLFGTNGDLTGRHMKYNVIEWEIL